MCSAFKPNLRERCVLMTENATIFGGFRGIGLSQPSAQITGKAPTCRKRQIEGCLDPNRRPAGECRLRDITRRPLASFCLDRQLFTHSILCATFVEHYTRSLRWPSRRAARLKCVFGKGWSSGCVLFSMERFDACKRQGDLDRLRFIFRRDGLYGRASLGAERRKA